MSAKAASRDLFLVTMRDVEHMTMGWKLRGEDGKDLTGQDELPESSASTGVGLEETCA